MRVVVAAPASIANLGSGFDCMAMAVSLENEWEVRFDELAPPSSQESPNINGNLLLYSIDRALTLGGCARPLVRVRSTPRIPMGSGLGSSASAIIGGLMAANEFMGRSLSQDDILDEATRIEGHPDNVAASLLGGVVVAVQDDGRVVARSLRSSGLSELHCAVAVPKLHLATKAARAALPEQVSLADAVFNVSRAALLVHALCSGDWSALGQACQDRLHQPHRIKLIPGAAEALAAAREAGACAAFISGSGPTICAPCIGCETGEHVGAAMVDAFLGIGIDAELMILTIAVNGARVISADRET